MTEELIIDGQRVDLASDTDITLEYVNNIIGDIGSLKLSHSYTIKLPRTVKNSRIFDAPEAPSHESSKVRKFFQAQYYKNGFDLIGPAQAYLLKTTADSYEVALVWNRAEALASWVEAKAKLPALSGLPTLTWVGAPLASTTGAGAFYAQYDSGLWKGASNVLGIHPCITLRYLLEEIFDNAGIAYTIGNNFAETLQNHALLVAPSHKPSFDMELSSGSQASSLKWITTTGSGSYWWFQNWSQGWDGPGGSSISSSRSIQRGTTASLRFYMNLKITAAPNNTLPDLYISLTAGGLSYILAPSRTSDGGYLLDTVVDLNSVLQLQNATDYFRVNIMGLTSAGAYTFQAYEAGRPLFALIRPHDTIPTERQNLFPIAPNLPDIVQLDFVKAVLGLFGGVMRVAHDGSVSLDHYDDILRTADAVDWTDKVNTDKGDPDISYTLSGYAQANTLKYEDDATLPVSPDITLVMEDQTAPEQKDLLKLPFAASLKDQARHYRRVGGSSSETWEDVDIKPRIFGFTRDSDGTLRLNFGDDLSGAGAISAHLARYQELIRKPVTLTLNVRLTELDLAHLNLLRPVYLGQYGQYYAIMKVQTSKGGECKVELLQIR